jgi:hypothetical protein
MQQPYHSPYFILYVRRKMKIMGLLFMLLGYFRIT